MGLLLHASLVQGSETFRLRALIDMALHNDWHTNTDFSVKVADDLTDWVDMIVKKCSSVACVFERDTHLELVHHH